MAIEWTTTEQRAPRLFRHKLMVCESAGEGFNVTTLTGEATREDLLRACEAEDIMATPHIAESDYKHALREDCAKLKDRCDKAEALLTRFLGLYRGPMGVVVDDIRAHLAEVGK